MTMHFYVMKLDGLFRWALCSQLLCNKWIVWTLMRAYCFFSKAASQSSLPAIAIFHYAWPYCVFHYFPCAVCSACKQL